MSVVVKDVGGASGVNAITIVPSGTDTVDGGPSQTISTALGRLTFTSDGTSDWMVTAS